MGLLLLGVSAPTDIERRVRELQRELYARQGLLEALALPVLIPLALRADPGAGSPQNPPAGRLEASRLVTGPFTIHEHWLLWSLHGPAELRELQGLRELADAWGGPFAEPLGPDQAGSRLPLARGFLLGFSRSAAVLEGALALLAAEPPRTFQPQALELYRLRPLAGNGASAEGGGRSAEAGNGAAPWDWARVLGCGLFWEEIGHKPLRRRA